MTLSILDLDRSQLAEALAAHPKYRIDQLWDGLYVQFKSVQEIKNLPAALRDEVSAQFPDALSEAARAVSDDGNTIKFLWHLTDGDHPIETVLMYYAERATVCVSTQAGCAMACGFCATGQAGFTRHLTTGEIVEQVVRAAREAGRLGQRIDNIVFMGMGEPLANEDNVRAAVERIHGDIGISARHLTVSTGIPFYDHMLDQLARHGGFDLTVKAQGDLHIDTHHTVEDVAITVGEALREALGDKAGVRRFASGSYPLDEALVDVALDLSGRPFVAWNVELPECLPLGNPAFDPSLAEHAVSSLATAGEMTLHVNLRAGRNVHHIIEATFKGLARCLRDAVRVESSGVPSTKGVL